jgi:hypothetical protein
MAKKRRRKKEEREKERKGIDRYRPLLGESSFSR